MVLNRVADFQYAHDLQVRHGRNRVAEAVAVALGPHILQQPLENLQQLGGHILQNGNLMQNVVENGVQNAVGIGR